MVGIAYASTTGYLTINGVSMHTPAWAIRDLLPLWGRQAVRGGNVVIPTVRGTRAYRRRTNEARHSLEMGVVGECNQSGTPYADSMIGLETNLAYLDANIVTTDSPNATVVATLLMPSGATRTADVQVEQITRSQHFLDLALVTVELVIPSGFFE